MVLCHLSGGMVFLVQIFVLIAEFIRAVFFHHFCLMYMLIQLD